MGRRPLRTNAAIPVPRVPWGLHRPQQLSLRRKGAGTLASSLLIDICPASGGHGERGIGRYVRSLATSITAFPDDLVRRIWAFGQSGPTLDAFGAHAIASTDNLAVAHVPGWLTGRLATRFALRKSGARVLHATDPHRPWTGRVPTVVTVYDLILLREPGMLESLRPDHRYMYRRYIRQVQSADRVIAISRSTAEDVEERLGIAPDRLDIVYPAVVAPEGFRRRVPAEPTFLVVGALDAHKQPELALRAFADFRTRAGSGRLRYVGPADQGQQRSLKELAARLGVLDAVSVEGRIPDDELERAYSTATALVSTSRLEGFGLPPVEALLRGIPVVAVDTAAARETLGTAAAIVPADVSAIATAMAHPIDPPALVVAEIRERFAFASVARSLEECYRRMID